MEASGIGNMMARRFDHKKYVIRIFLPVLFVCCITYNKCVMQMVPFFIRQNLILIMHDFSSCRMCPTMIRRCMVTLVAINYPSVREPLAKLMAHSLTTSKKWYNVSIKDKEVSTNCSCMIDVGSKRINVTNKFKPS